MTTIPPPDPAFPMRGASDPETDSLSRGKVSEDPTLILTRPEPASEAFLRALGGWSGRAILSPLLEIAAVDAPRPETPAAALIFTSKNAVLHYSGPVDLPAFCVGTATNSAARDRGLASEQVAQDAAGLVAALPGLDPPEPLVHVRGVHVAQPVAEMLCAAGLTCLEWIVYDQVARALTTQALAALARPEPLVLPVFSPRSADLLGTSLRRVPPQARCVFVAMSAAVATHITDLVPEAEVFTAKRPDLEAMVAAVHASARHVRALEGRPPLP